MENCCNPIQKQGNHRASCPRCGVVGRTVGDETIRAILRPGLAASLLAVERRFCRTPTCDVIYYGPDGQVADKDASRVRIGVKETENPVPLCYCFNFNMEDVRREIAETGNCSIPGKITAEVKAGHCACEVKNPSGACCLGDVNKAVSDAKTAMHPVFPDDVRPPQARR